MKPQPYVDDMGFQSTRPCGARLAQLLDLALDFPFQSTRPCGARLAALERDCRVCRFQSTRPCGARRVGVDQPEQIADVGVSIHAPLRGATPQRRADQKGPRVSIHAPLRGATRQTVARSSVSTFQSTRPCGARPAPDPERRLLAPVSIHAPLRGATLRNDHDAVRVPVSIHAPLRGATLLRPSPKATSSGFNPRAPAGRDATPQ